MKLIQIILYTIAITLLSNLTSSYAKTYYVDPNGNDNNLGSQDKPWNTISVAVSKLNAGDELILKSGTYNQTDNVKIQKSNIKIRGEGKVEINPTYSQFWQRTSNSWVIVDSKTQLYRSQNPISNTTPGSISGSFLWNGKLYQFFRYPTLEQLNATYQYLGGYYGPGIYLDDQGYVFVRFSGTEQMVNKGFTTIPTNPNQIRIYLATSGSWLIGYKAVVDNVHISNLTFIHSSILFHPNTTNSSISDLLLYGHYGENAILVSSGCHNITIKNNYLDGFQPSWITWQDIKLTDRNKIRIQDHAILIDGDVYNVSIIGNHIQNIHDGIWAAMAQTSSINEYNLEISSNDLLNIQDDAIQLGSNWYNVNIDHNKMIATGTSVSRHANVANPSPGKKYIHHNIIDTSSPKLFFRKRADGSFSQTPDGSPVKDVPLNGEATLPSFGLHVEGTFGKDGDPRKIYNNTVIVRDQTIGYHRYGLTPDLRSSSIPEQVFNNIFIQIGTKYIGEALLKTDKTLMLNGNLHYRKQSSSDMLWAGIEGQSNIYNWNEFQQKTGWEGNGVFADPILDANYTPTSSVAKGGINLSSYSFPGVDGIYRGAINTSSSNPSSAVITD
jgi:hypothetical protein